MVSVLHRNFMRAFRRTFKLYRESETSFFHVEIVLLISSDVGSSCVNQGKQLASSWCSDFDMFFRFVWQLGLVSSTLWIGGEGLQSCSAWGDVPADVPSMITRSRF